MKYTYLFILILWLMTSQLLAQFTIAGYPYVAYSSETRLMGGAFSFIRYDFAQRSSRASINRFSLLGNTIYSQNKQFMLALIPQYEKGAISLESSMLFSKWPDTYFGTGNFTDPEQTESFTSETYAAENTLRYLFNDRISAALQMDIGIHHLAKTIEGGMLESSAILGKKDSAHLGLGAGIRYDSSEGGYYPRRGLKLEIKQIWYDKALGSDFSWQKNLYDLRFYIPMGESFVLASQSDLELNNGDLPFYRYPELGMRLRAYESKRFIDKVRISQRLEQRMFLFSAPGWRRLGFVAFAEAGQVAPTFEQISADDLHWSLGGGLRFSVLPKERLNLRADIGFGEDSVNFIINAREVF